MSDVDKLGPAVAAAANQGFTLDAEAFEQGFEDAQQIMSGVDLVDVPEADSDEDATAAFYAALEE